MFKNVIEKEHNNCFAYAELASLHQKIGQIDNAIVYYEQALKLGLKEPFIYRNLIELYKTKGLTEKAVQLQAEFNKL